MRDRLTVLRKALDKETKEKEAAANKTVRDVHLRLHPHANFFWVKAVEAAVAFFHKNPQAEAYFAIIDVEGNAKVFGTLQNSLIASDILPSGTSGRCAPSEKTR
jgi:alanyl-tRNA synthetase